MGLLINQSHSSLTFYLRLKFSVCGQPPKTLCPGSVTVTHKSRVRLAGWLWRAEHIGALPVPQRDEEWGGEDTASGGGAHRNEWHETDVWRDVCHRAIAPSPHGSPPGSPRTPSSPACLAAYWTRRHCSPQRLSRLSAGGGDRTEG